MINSQKGDQMSEEIITLEFEDNQSVRLDHFLTEELPDYSRSRLQSFIKEGRVRIDGEAAKKYGQILVPGQMVTVVIPEVHESGLVPENIPLDILYEDEESIVINKPAGMVVHPAAGHASGTLVNAVLAHCDDLSGFGGEIRPGVVHRLDRDTSGIIVMAKNEKAHIFLQQQFKDRSINKRYLALVDGAPPTPTGRVEAPIGRDPVRRQQMAILTPDKGREAVTEYKTIKSYSKHTLIEAHPLTGRTHQIRVHMAFLKCPIVGDVLYGRRKQSIELNRHFLHAYRLTILLPGHQEPMTFEAPLPAELQAVLDGLS